jgi:hypothetical protein
MFPDTCWWNWWRKFVRNFNLYPEINGRGYSLRWPRNTLYSQKLSLTSPTSGSCSVGIVRLRTKSHLVCLVMCRRIFSLRNHIMVPNIDSPSNGSKWIHRKTDICVGPQLLTTLTTKGDQLGCLHFVRSSFSIYSTLKIEAIHSSMTSVNFY